MKNHHKALFYHLLPQTTARRTNGKTALLDFDARTRNLMFFSSLFFGKWEKETNEHETKLVLADRQRVTPDLSASAFCSFVLFVCCFVCVRALLRFIRHWTLSEKDTRVRKREKGKKRLLRNTVGRKEKTVTSREFNIICHMNRVYNLSESTLRELIKKNRGVDDFTAHFFIQIWKKERAAHFPS